MINSKYVATKDLFQSLIRAKRDFARGSDDHAERSTDEDGVEGTPSEERFSADDD